MRFPYQILYLAKLKLRYFRDNAEVLAGEPLTNSSVTNDLHFSLHFPLIEFPEGFLDVHFEKMSGIRQNQAQLITDNST